jgi:membrane protein implicated in regulation of membrane protease activity
MTPMRIALCLTALDVGCSQASSEPAPRAATSAPTAAPDRAQQLQSWIPTNAPPGAAPPRAAAPSAALLRGTVRETMNAGGYTYLRIEAGGADRWVATTQMPIAVGDQVVVDDGAVMTAFHSRTLDRTFDTILFAGAVRLAGAAAPTVAAPTVAAPTVAAPTPSGARRGIVRETMNSGGYTYLRVEGDGASAWVAVPVTSLAVGDEVEVPPGNEMPGFHSRTLDRSFAQLTFASEARVVRSGAAR